MRYSEEGSFRGLRRLGVAAAILIGASGLAASAQAQGITLHVFGPSSLDMLAPRQSPEDQQRIQQEVIDGFLAANPDVAAVAWDAQGPQAGGVQRLMTAKLGGQPMDIIACSANTTNGTLVRRKLVRAITEEIKPFQDRIDAAALGAFTISGEVYGVPISTLSTSTFYYNVELFEQLGIPAPPTYDDLKAAVPKLTEAGIIPILHQGSNAPLWPMWFFETFSQASGDPIGLTVSNLEGTTRFDDPADVEGFRLIKQWVDDGLLSRDSLSVDQDGMRAAFASGKSAMYYGGTWEIPALQEAVKDFTWGVFAFPKMPGTPGDPKHGGGADNGICLSSDIPEENVDAAVRFIEYLTRPEVATLYLAPEQPIAASIAGVPVVEDAYAQELRRSAFPDTIKFLDWIWPTEVTNTVAASIAGVVAGDLTPEDAAASVQKAFDDLKAQGGWPPE